jgi:hypothetical protein
MQNGRRHPISAAAASPLDLLLRDMHVLGRLDANRLHAVERLAAALGDDLLAAIDAELGLLDTRALPPSRRSRRVA